jgi:cytochrome c2
LTWLAGDLDGWLSDPHKFVPGTRMPVKILDPIARRDIIAYLETETRNASAAAASASIAQHAP